MKAYEIQESFGLDSLKLTERPDPKPGAGEVVIKMKALSLNFRDLLVVTGRYNPRMQLPRIPCSDGVGEVVDVGEGVSRVKVGDRVAGAFMPGWVEGEANETKGRSALGGEVDGLLAEYAVLPAEGVVHLPEHLSDEEGATLPCAGVTAWNSLVDAGNIKAGDTVLLLGTGGVSLFALQFAKMHGARTIITSSSDEKLERARALGADETINYKTTPKWDKEIFQLTARRGVDHVVEVGGAGTLPQSIRASRIGGHIALIGVLAGGSEMNPLPIVMKGIRVSGIFVGSRAMFENMNQAIAQAKMKPIVDRVFGFDEVHDALRHMESGAHFGKIAIRV